MAPRNAKTLLRRVSLLLVGAMLAPLSMAELPKYQLKDLGTLGGANSRGSAINDAGQVTGASETADGSTHAFLFSGGELIDLGTLGGSDSFGQDINAQGQVTGRARTTLGLFHAFLYSDGHMEDLGTFGGFTSGGEAINDSGQVTGSARDQFQDPVAFVYSDGQMQNLFAVVDAPTFGKDISNAEHALIGLFDFVTCLVK